MPFFSKLHTAKKMPVIIKKSTFKPESAIVFLHGLQESGERWANILEKAVPRKSKILCPCANKMILKNEGKKMTSWFDLKKLLPMPSECQEDIVFSSNKIRELIDEQIDEEIPPHKIVLAGYGQGAAVAAYTAVTMGKPLAGLLMLSGWLPLASYFPNNASCPKNIPVYQAHGYHDTVAPIVWGKVTATLLKNYFEDHTFKVFRRLDSNPCENEEIRQFLCDTLQTTEKNANQ